VLPYIQFVQIFLISVIHWIYAFKYWGLSLKLREILSNGESTTGDLKLGLVFISGVLMIIVACLIILIDLLYLQNPNFRSDLWKWLLFFAGMGTVFMSCIFIADAFIRMKSLKVYQGLFLPNDVILKHVSTFGFYAISFIMFFSL
jgi:hypothetical protein